MRISSLLSISLALLTAVSVSLSADSKPSKYTAQPTSSAPHLKPLKGQIDTYAPSVDAEDFAGQPGRGAYDRGGLQGGAYDRGLSGNADELSGGIDDNGPYQGNATSVPLRGQQAREDFDRRYRLDGDRTRLSAPISAAELKLLKSHDVVVMQDRSSSMGEKEHFPGSRQKISRWRWCNEQALDLLSQTQAIPKWSLTLVLFSSQFDVYPNVTLPQLPAIFQRQGIFIGTRLAEPLALQLDEHFYKRSKGSTKPLSVVVITDGKPQDDEDLRDVIIQATHRMKDPGEVRVTFLQVGNDEEGQKKLRKLDQKLLSKGARYDIVDVVPYYDVCEAGLTRSLVNTLKNGIAQAR